MDAKVMSSMLATTEYREEDSTRSKLRLFWGLPISQGDDCSPV